MTRNRLFVYLAIAATGLLFSANSVQADTIVTGNVTDFFGNQNAAADSGDASGLLFDEARTSGGDSPANSANIAIPRNLVAATGANNNWAAGTTTGTPGTLTFTGLGLTLRGGTTATNAGLTIRYFGADGVFGGVDDEVVGSTSNDLTYVNTNEYIWEFDTPIVFDWDGLDNRFRFDISGTDGNIRYKTQFGGSTPSGQGGPSLSVAGSFTSVAVPEPSSLTALAGVGFCALARRRKRLAQ